MSSSDTSARNSSFANSPYLNSAVGSEIPNIINVRKNGRMASWIGFHALPETPAEQHAVRRFLIDALLVLSSSTLACWVSLGANVIHAARHDLFIRTQSAAIILYASLTLLTCFCVGLYKAQLLLNWREHLERSAGAVVLATGIFLPYIWISGVHRGMTTTVLFLAAMNGFSLVTWRSIRAKQLQLQCENGLAMRNLLILGASQRGLELAQSIRNQPFGFSVVGFLDDEVSIDGSVLGRSVDLEQVVKSHFVNEVIIAPPWNVSTLNNVLAVAERFHLDVGLLPDVDPQIAAHPRIEYLGNLPLLSIREEPIPEFSLMIKRLIDIVASSVLLILLFPLLVLIALAIKLDSPGTILYRAPRVGRKGHSFIFYKFRTMVPDADAKKSELRQLNERSGPFFKLFHDPRVTRLGSFLRKYSLDELPQLWNVLNGDMSLVGPRPHPVDDCSLYSIDHLRRLNVTPGVTGLWQVSARNDSSFEISMALDLEYIENWSLWLDLRILLKTIPVVFKATGQ